MLITIKRQQYATMNGCVDVAWLCYCFVVLFADFLSEHSDKHPGSLKKRQHKNAIDKNSAQKYS
jgi:hypothetical protein